MKIFIIAAVFIALCSGRAPTASEDNSHYVEGESVYSDGAPVIMDLQEPVDEAFLKSSNGGNWVFTRNGVINNGQDIITDNRNTIVSADGSQITITGNDKTVRLSFDRVNLSTVHVTVTGNGNRAEFQYRGCVRNAHLTVTGNNNNVVFLVPQSC